MPEAASLAPQSTAALPSAAPDDTGPRALAIFHEVLLGLAHGTAQESFLRLLVEKARLLTGCASAAIALLHEDREEVVFAAVSGEAADELQGTRVRAADTLLGGTARTGEPYLAFRPAAAPLGNGAAMGVHSAAVVPIFEDGHPVGALAALNKADNKPFAGDDLLSLSTLAAAASVALANHRLRSDSQRQSRELSTLYEAVRSVAGQLSAQEVLTAVMEQVAAHIENVAVAVFLVNDERTHLYIAADRGLEEEQREVTLPTDIGLGAAAMTATRPLFLRFRADDEEYGTPAPGSLGAASPGSFDAPFPGLPQRSAVAAPIRSGEVVHGLVLAVSGQFDAYALADANLLSALAAQAAVAMENAWLYEDATRRAEEAAALYELSQTITSTLRLPDVMDMVADSVLSLLAVDKFALFLHDKQTDRLQMVVARGLAPGAAERIRPEMGQGIPGWVLEFETPTAVQDVAADHRNATAPLHPEGVVSMTCMPLQVGAATIGVLCAMSARRRLFTVAEMELLYTIANQAAIAIENARIYADVRQKALELRKYFHRVARALGSSQSPGDVPHLIASLTLEVMGADRCALYSVGEGPEGPQLKIEAAVNFRLTAEAEGAALTTREDLPAGWIARRARPLTIEDLTEDARFADRLSHTVRGRVTSYLGVPLRIGRQVVGVLEVYTRAYRRWHGDEVRLLLTFASQATVAFQNARLAAQSGRAERDRQTLQRLLDLAASGEPGLEAVLDALAKGLDGGLIALVRDERGDWRVAAHRRVPEADLAASLPHLIEAASGGEITRKTDFVVTAPGSARIALALLCSEAPPTDEQASLLASAARLYARERPA